MANPIVQETIDQIKETVGVIDSAITFINGVSDMIKKAVEAAIGNGATADELAPFTELEASLQAQKEKLAAAIAANS